VQSNIDSIVARNANVGKNLDVKKRFELKLKEKDEMIEALRNELETLSEEMSKKMNHLELYAAMVESYETKLKIKDSIIEHLNFDLKQEEEEKQIDPIIMEDNSTIKDQIIAEKNSLIQSLMNFNEKLKKKNQILSNMNKDTLMYSKILTLQEEFDEIQHYREQELKEKEKELKEMEREMKKKEKEMMEWKQLLMEREQELKEKEIQLME
jgi:chromosome segregation ATPase